MAYKVIKNKQNDFFLPDNKKITYLYLVKVIN